MARGEGPGHTGDVETAPELLKSVTDRKKIDEARKFKDVTMKTSKVSLFLYSNVSDINRRTLCWFWCGGEADGLWWSLN
jgi:hypothetical protein